MGSAGSSGGKESTYNEGDLGLIPGLGRFPRRRAWQPTPVFLPGESPWTGKTGMLQSMGSQKVGHIERLNDNSTHTHTHTRARAHTHTHTHTHTLSLFPSYFSSGI